MNQDDIYYILHGKPQPRTKNPDTNEWITIRTIVTPNGATETITEVHHEGQTKEETEADHKSLEILTRQFHQQAQAPLANINTVADVVFRYINSKKEGGTVDAKGLEALQKHLQLFQEYFGNDTDIKTIRLEQAEAFKNLLLKLPPNRSKNPKYKGKSLQQIADIGDKPQSIATVKGIIQKCSTFFTWATKADYVEKNYFQKMKMPKDTRKESEQRQRWSDSDLHKLFQLDYWADYQSVKGVKHPYYYWLPLLGLYTGARLNELAQLKPGNVKVIDGLLCFDINENAAHQKLKNTSSKRAIPVHQHLIDLGFDEYLKTRQGKNWLFDGLLVAKGKNVGKPPRDGMSQNVSKWFNRLRTDTSLKHVDFHSFRHTVADELKQKQIPEQQASALLGHKDQSITYARYGKDLNVHLLKQTIDNLNFLPALANVRRWK
ncbi:site-specific integrase [Vibrio coralliilyticus]